MRFISNPLSLLDTLDQEVFAFMTTEPNELTAGIKHERILVLLSEPEHYDTWLNGPPEEGSRWRGRIQPRQCASCSRVRRICYGRLRR